MRTVTHLFLLYCALFLTAVSAISQDSTENKNYRYKGDKNSFLEWNKLDIETWLDFDHWKKGRVIRDETPDWKQVVVETSRTEQIGKVLDCVGECIIVRDDTSFHAHFKTTLLEMDEFTTMGSGYAWIYLFDGTLVRISPESSITFKEFNVGPDSFFIHARVNFGNVYWVSRTREKLKEVDARETDTIFLPLKMGEANPPLQETKFEDSLIEGLMRDKNRHLKRYQVLNDLIDENNKVIDSKRTLVWLVTPGGSVWADFLHLDVYALFGNETFIRSRTTNYYTTSQKKDDLSRISLYPHFPPEGEEENAKVEPMIIEEGKWYSLKSSGRQISEYPEGDELFHISEFPTLRIPSILIAREHWLKKYSTELYNKNITAQELAEVYGYRLWAKSNDIHGDFARRALFVKRHSRKNERSINRALVSLKKSSAEREESLFKQDKFGPQFYGQSMNRYLNPSDRSD